MLTSESDGSMRTYAAAMRSCRRKERWALLAVHAGAFVAINLWFLFEFGVVNAWWGIGLLAHGVYAFWLGGLLVDREDRQASQQATTEGANDR